KEINTQIAEIHIVATENECKEILLLVNKKTENNSPKIFTRNFLKNNTENNLQTFDFELVEEKAANVKFAENIKKYLYEPNAAVMKSGAYRLVSQRFGLEKLATNTHLYFSDELIENFCGKIFAVKDSWGNAAKTWKEKLKKLEKANISTRNYPLNTNELRKKLKLQDGGNTFLFACTLAAGKKTILEVEKINKN
ncbi:MAG: SAM-dependent methyltransferase, partial [Paludibacter sp.]|nr:SAM-dependent methyltransferase [Paludibacter sp.]